jgi:ankyrin repeat protein
VSHATSKLLTCRFVAQTNAAGYTALHVAAAASASECILELLDNGALVDLTDIFGNSPLHVMVAASDSEYSVLLLLTHRADPNLCNDDGNSALHIAALHNHHRSLQQLLLHGGDPTALNVFGLSPHILAVRR